MSTLLAIRGPLTGARVRLEEESTIGRSPSCTVELADSTVSRHHAIIRKHRLGWILEDCESVGGTILNGHPIREPVSLSPNDEIRIGHSVFLFDSDFDLQNADFTDNSVYLAAQQDETMTMIPVATLDAVREACEVQAKQGMELLTEIGELFDSTRVGFGDALRSTLERMSHIMRSETSLLMLYDHGARTLRASAAVSDGDVLADRNLLTKVFSEKRAVLLSDKPELATYPSDNAPSAPAFRSVICAPLLIDDACLGVVSFQRHELDAYTLKDLRLAQSLARLLSVFIEARQRAEALALRVNYQSDTSSVVGGSKVFKRVLDMIRRVADTPATVMLIGETGTGKEVLASELHRLSPQGRGGRPFVAVNCAAIPETLFESQLFGHEKGSFTGAHKTHQGYIEQAHGGTLFLDEIGELTLALQPKLLRFLQEHTFTRVGGNRVHRADARIIVATNRDLTEEVRAGRFREDLFHRLNVMPITVPALRERREDIKALAEYFCNIYAKKFAKEIIGISDEALIQLEKYDWPGNVRELSNCMERAVLLSDDKVLLPRNFILAGGGRLDVADTGRGRSMPTGNQLAPPPEDPHAPLEPLSEVEKRHILKVMDAVGHNQVRASEVLGIHRNTLRKKLQEYE